MEAMTMGRVVTEATIEYLKKLWDAQRGQVAPDQVRRVTVTDALIDTRATKLSLPTRLIRQLGLVPMSSRRVSSSTGGGQAMVYEAVRPTIQGRYCAQDVKEVPNSVPALIGQLPLENLDFVNDPVSRRLIGNPAHGGEHVLDAY